ncbi:unnamed protein product, partial [Brenthis ino]
MHSEWFDRIKRPCFVVAPMVDASELAWRLLCRRHGATLCYTPMLHSTVFTKDPKYRKENFTTCNKDRPLIVQFCGNNPDTMAAAAKFVETDCDAIDINLGCPQSIAKRGHYGSFLQDDWILLQQIVTTMTQAVSVPITCKVRIFESIEKSVQYALMLQKAGCKLLTVHGRTREQKGPLTEKQSLYQCLQMATSNACKMYIGINAVTWEIALEYLELVEQYPCPSSYIRGHLFKIFHKIFTIESNNEERQLLATAQNLDDFKQVCIKIKEKYLLYHEGKLQLENNEGISRNGFDLILPPWLCQPYVRMSPEEHTQKMEKFNQKQDNNNDVKRTLEDTDGNIMSRKKMKKMRRILRRPARSDLDLKSSRSGNICVNENCPNPLGGKCVYQLCKKCCRNKCFEEDLDCKGHRILVHTRREMAKKFALDRIENI